MLNRLTLAGIGPVSNLSAEFGSRLNVLTGDNGLGKSFLLDICFWALTGSWPGHRVAIPDPDHLDDGDRPVPPPRISLAFDVGTDRSIALFSYQYQTWVTEDALPSVPAIVIYAGVDGSFFVSDAARSEPRRTMESTLKLRLSKLKPEPSTYHFSPQAVAEGLKDGDRVFCNGLIQDWVTWYYRRSNDKGASPFDYIEKVVSALAHPEESILCVDPRRVFLDDSREFPVLRMPYGDVAFPHWSASVRRIVNFAYILVWAWNEHLEASRLRGQEPVATVVFIIDEIDAHLHPKWQRTILPALMEVMNGLSAGVNIQMFSTTHSPLVLASLESRFDPAVDKLFWFDLQQGKVTFQEFPWAIQGDVDGWLTSEIFGLRQARSKEAEVAIEAAEAYMRGDKKQLPIGLQTKAQIHRALTKSLANLDPFWPRWIVKTGQLAK